VSHSRQPSRGDWTHIFKRLCKGVEVFYVVAHSADIVGRWGRTYITSAGAVLVDRREHELEPVTAKGADGTYSGISTAHAIAVGRTPRPYRHIGLALIAHDVHDGYLVGGCGWYMDNGNGILHLSVGR
jgi:hypothetical protein